MVLRPPALSFSAHPQGERLSSSLLTALLLPANSFNTLQIVIKDEQLVASAEIEAKGSYEEDFELFRGDGIVEGDVPAYYLYR